MIEEKQKIAEKLAENAIIGVAGLVIIALPLWTFDTMVHTTCAGTTRTHDPARNWVANPSTCSFASVQGWYLEV